MLRNWLCIWLLALAASASAADPVPVVVSYPGPHNISYLPIDLIPRLGFDRDEGLSLRFLHTGGGGVALANLMKRNADFAVAGFPAAMSQRAGGGAVVGVAAVDDAPLFVLMVRADLAGSVKRPADLKGRIVGVNTSSMSSKTTSQQLAELVLRADGVRPDQVRLVPAGQTWSEQSSLILSKSVDAIMGDEPYASRLKDAGKVFFLTNLAEPESSRGIPGAGFLHAALETRQDVIDRQPDKVERMVRMLRRTLLWMSSHDAEEVVAKLGIRDAAEQASLVASLKKYSHLYSRDGSFSTAQLAETERFFQQGAEGDPRAENLKIEAMILDRWAGRRP